MNNENSHIFVYGTLKNGEPNHEKWLKNGDGKSKFVGVAQTVFKWPLVIATKYNVPFLLKAPGVGKRVIGDLFCIDEQKLQLLDCLENHPHHYVRQDISVTLIKKDELASIDLLNEMCCCSNLAIASDFTCQAYFIEDFTEYLLNYKHYESYKDGIDDKSYVKPEHRPEGYWRDYYHALHKQPLNGF